MLVFEGDLTIRRCRTVVYVCVYVLFINTRILTVRPDRQFLIAAHLHSIDSITAFLQIQGLNFFSKSGCILSWKKS